MGMLSPSPTTDHAREELIHTLREMIGLSITDVSYLVPSSSEQTAPSRATGFDQADMGIEVVLSDGRTFVAVWNMKGYCEGLAFGVFQSNTYARGERVKSIGAGELDEWKGRSARAITSVGLAWHLPDDRCPETIWSVRVGVDGADVVIALGEAKESDHIRYQPDSLVSIFGADVANSYEILASGQTAWGADV